MLQSLSSTAGTPRRARGWLGQPPAARSRAIIAVFVAILILAFGFLSTQSKPVRASADSQDGRGSRVTNQAGSLQIALTAHQMQHNQIVKLAEEMLAKTEAASRRRDDLIKQQIAVRTAEVSYQNAKMAREIAEIAVTEYERGIFVQDLAVAEGEIKLARSELERARQEVEQAKERLARIKRASRGSAVDLNLEYMYTDRVAITQLQEQKAALAIEQAESKKAVLIEATKPKRILELRAEAHKARSEELAKQANWESERSKEERLRKEMNPDLADSEKRPLALLNQALPLDEQVRSKLGQFARTAKPDAPFPKEIRDLTNQLQVVLDQVDELRRAEDARREEAHFADLKRRLNRAASRYLIPGPTRGCAIRRHQPAGAPG